MDPTPEALLPEPISRSDRGGLTPRQKEYAREILVRISQGNASARDLETLRRFREWDETEFVHGLLDAALVHPDFNNEGQGVDNLHKNALIRERILKTSRQIQQIDKKTQKLSIDVLNSLRALDRAEDGRKVGDKRHSEIIDVSPTSVENEEHTRGQ